MKVSALKYSGVEIPNAPLIIELQDGKKVVATGFYHSENKQGKPVVVINAGKTLAI